MNESEARRAALTAAVTVNATWHMEEPGAILALAERFEEWLTRPAQLIPKETPADVGPGPVKTTRPNPYCTACEHAPHGAGACSVACSCPGYATCTYTDAVPTPDVPQQRIPHDPYMDGPEPWIACTGCAHERHPGAYCSQCPCAHGRRPR